MSIASLGYIGFEVNSIAQWSQFLEDWLGLMRGDASDERINYRMDSRSTRIIVEHGAKDDIAFIGLEANTLDDFAQVKQRLSDLDISYESVGADQLAVRGVRDMISLQDPAGLRVEVFVGPTELTNVPFNSPTGVSGFVTGEQGVGHIVLASKNIEAVREFYTAAFDFKLSDTIAMPMGPDASLMLEFYHCNPRHHTLALVGMPAPKRLNHFMVEMNSLDDVGYALDRIEAFDIKLFMTLGKHSNDEMISFYVATPIPGVFLEVGWGGLAVDDATWRVQHHTATSMWGHKIVL